MKSALHIHDGADALLERARELERRGAPAVARETYERMLREGALPAGTSSAALLRWIGNTYRASGDASAAADCFRASLESARAAGSDLDMAHALNWLGVLAQERGEYDEATSLHNDARTLAEHADSPRTVALVLQNLAVIATLHGDRARALRHNMQCLRIYRELGDDAATARLQNNLGILLMMVGRTDDAAAAFDEAAAACERARDFHTRAMVEASRTELHYRNGELELALRSCERAQAFARQIENRLALGESYRWLGAVQRERGEFAEAEACLDAAAAIGRQLDQPLLEAQVRHERGLLYHRQERYQEAMQSLNLAHTFFRGAHALPLLADVEGAIDGIESVFLDIVQRWGDSIERKDLYTRGHCQRVADYACRLARLSGLDEQTLKWFRMGALLHDVGKIAIPSEILNKPGALSDSERSVMERHTIVGEVMLGTMKFPWDIRPMIRSHHERWDGAGYPDGIGSERIPLAARILCVADIFDALTSTRSYRPAFSRQQALEIMRSDVGQCDPVLLARFTRLVGAGAADDQAGIDPSS